MNNVALGVTIFQRIGKLETLLDSIDPAVISMVYVADDGERTDRKAAVYDREYPFDLAVIDLEFDAGLGCGRKRIVEALDADYLLLLDCDMEMPHNVGLLKDQLESRPEYGGICGLLLEGDRMYTSCTDLFVEDGAMIKDIRTRKEVTTVAGAPLIEFDFIANAALFRRECLTGYCWDPNYVIGREHIDFYTGHYLKTDWTFGLCPEVVVPHHPGGDDAYESHRYSDRKYETAERYYLEKWGFDEFKSKSVTWIDTYDPLYGAKPPFSLVEKARAKYRSGGLATLLVESLRYVVDRGRRRLR